MTQETETIIHTFNPFWAPYIRDQCVRMIWDGKDVTPPVPHDRNRRVIAETNAKNAEIAARYGVPAPVYRYDEEAVAAALQEQKG